MSPEEAAVLRDLLETPRVLSLGVLVDGVPYVGLLPFAVTGDRRALLVHASRLARHTRGLTEGAPYSALIHAADDPAADPLQLPRVTFQGEVHPLAGDSDEGRAGAAAYQARFPQSEVTFTLGDFVLYALRLREGRLVAGFGRARNVSPGDLATLG